MNKRKNLAKQDWMEKTPNKNHQTRTWKQKNCKLRLIPKKKKRTWKKQSKKKKERSEHSKKQMKLCLTA